MGIIIRKEVWRIQYSQGTLKVSNHKEIADDNNDKELWSEKKVT